MWASSTTSRGIAKFAVFFIFFVMASGLLYTVSYESWMRKSNETAVVSSGTATTTATSSQSSKAKKAVSRPALQKLPWKKTMTTLFWVGEAADADNAFITNTASYWDERWQEHFGGIDSPDCRNGYYPCAFVPKENPFYFALPYAEYDENGEMKPSAKNIPWYQQDSLPLLKNRWIAVRKGETVCYGQWQDVGPNNEDDYGYVFGDAQPKNTFGERAGLDISPALWRCLEMSDNDQTDWAFVDVSAVPDGPWKDEVTTSGISWGL